MESRFEPHTPLGTLDWPPSVQTTTGGVVIRIYDPAERLRILGEPENR
jgi:hypothetical protein